MAVVRHAAARVLSLVPKAAPNFTLTKHPPQLLTPNHPTPQQSLYLSNIDDQLGLRYQIPLHLLYSSNKRKNNEKEKDPAKVIKEALAKVLVHYYPFAGRLREADNGKLRVDCTGEGILFVEADADISLEELGDLHAPIPGGDDFIRNVPGSETITDSPLLLIQVTRLRCGGFVLGIRLNHCMTDGVGIARFLKAVGEMARGAASPVIPPVWNREILRPRSAKPSIKYPHHEYDHVEDKHEEFLRASAEEMNFKSFFFGSKEIDALKRRVDGFKCSAFDVLSASLWKCRTKALNIPAEQDLRLIFAVDARSRFQPPLPTGFYGNAIGFGCAQAQAGDVSEQPLSFSVKLIKEAKRMIDDDYMRSVIDMMEVRGRPVVKPGGFHLVSDISKLEVGEADFGWGKPVYAGVGKPVGLAFLITTHFSRSYLRDFEGIVIPVYLPSVSMEKFEENINKLMN